MDPMVMEASKIKKYVLGGSGFIFAVTLVVFAMAVAQRDSRTKDISSDPTQAAYANQTAEGIAHDPTTNEETWPPPILVRSNDTALADSTAQGTEAERQPGGLPELPNVTNLPSGNPLRSLNDSVASNEVTGRLSDSTTTDAPPFAEPPPLGAVEKLPEITSTDFANVPGELGTAGPNGDSNSASNGQNQALPSLTPPELSNSLPDFGGATPSLPPLLGDQAQPALEGNEINSDPSPLPSSRNLAHNVSGDAFGVPPSNNGQSNSNLPNNSNEIAGTPTIPQTSPFGSSAANLPQTPTGLPAQTNSSNLPQVNSDGFNSVSAPNFSNSSQPPAAAPGSSSSSPSTLNNQLPTSSMPSVQSFGGQPSQATPTAPSNPSASFPAGGGLKDVESGTAALNAAMVSSAAGAAALLSSAAPGMRQLEGAQNPSLEIHKQAPAEVQVGVPASFKLIVRNVGTASAFDVAVHDSVPKGAKLVKTTPSAQVDAEGKILWKLGEMAAGSEQVLTLDLTPETEGELGSVASVTFAAQASVRTVSTQPKLIVKQTVGSTVLGGEVASIVIEVTNTGTGTARNVELEEDVPANMRHASGVSTLGLTIGDLAPGESEKVVIELMGVSAGKAINRVRAISSNNAAYESETEIDVVLPKLVVNLEGPRLRYLERQATYRASISNTGTAIAHDVELLLYLPKGLEYTSAANEGTYLRDQHAVVWSLAELAAGATVNTEVTLLPVQEGEFVLRMQCDAVGLQAEAIDKKVQVEGQSELAFTVEDDNDPIETDGLTTYIVRITNAGTRIDSNVQLVFELPEGSSAEQVHAPVNHQPSQRAIVFEPISRMQPKDTQIYRIAVRHSREGTIVARAQLKSDNRPVPVIKEESTHVYRDN